MSLDALRALQLADSGFPSGAFTYSWGMETAAEDGRLDRATLGAWLAVEMLGRWAQFDRIVLADAYRADDALPVDAETDRLFMAEPVRARSAEAGQAFLSAAARLGDPAARRFRAAVLDGEAAGHLPVAQGAVFPVPGPRPRAGAGRLRPRCGSGTGWRRGAAGPGRGIRGAGHSAGPAPGTSPLSRPRPYPARRPPASPRSRKSR